MCFKGRNDVVRFVVPNVYTSAAVWEEFGADKGEWKQRPGKKLYSCLFE